MTTEPVPTLAREMLELFQQDLRDVSFGDLNAAELARRAEEVRLRAQEVEAARAVLEEAKAALDEARADLTRLAEQSLAYAQIYAAERPELAEQLQAIAPTATPKRKRRKSKTSAELPFEGEKLDSGQASASPSLE